MRCSIARRSAILLAGMLLLLWPLEAASTRAGATDAHDHRRPAVAPAATSFFWYSPTLNSNTIPQRISSLAFDPQTAGLALAASGNAGDAMQQTTDHAVTWSALSGPSDTRYAYRLTYGH